MIPWHKVSKVNFLGAMNACLGNARALLREAHLLDRAARFQRAAVLTVLAMEEVGKVVFFVVVSHRDRATLSPQTLKALTKRFLNHEAKIEYLLDYKWTSILYVRRRKHQKPPRALINRLIKAHDTIETFLDTLDIEALDLLKQRCCFVDLDRRDGRARPPLQIPRSISAALLTVAESRLEDAEKLRDMFRRASTDSLAEAIINVTFKSQILHATVDALAQEEGFARVADLFESLRHERPAQ